MEQQQRGQWKSRWGFILAAAGSAVGLGNIWKFPYITGENGGGLFVLIYLICIALVGVPIMMSEIMIGRAAQKQPVAAFHELSGKRSPWAGLGWIGVIAGFLIASYYIVVAGWAMDFTLKSMANFTGPIHDKAVVDAAAYRAATPVEDMRAMLAEREADRASRDEITRAKREAPASVWRNYDTFTNALQQTDRGYNESRAALLEDETLRDAVQRIEGTDDTPGLQAKIDRIRSEHLDEATRAYAEMSDTEISNEATEVERRAAVLAQVQAAFLSVATDGWTSTFWAAIFMSITILIVARGISNGIERACKILMPTLMILILVMVGYGATQTGFGEAISFVFKPDPTKLKASGVLEALGHAFFTLSLGMGAMITYGSYQRKKEGLAGESLAIAGFDTGIAIAACLMIFPITFTYGQEPGAGPGLVFMSMPLAFAEIGKGGILLAILFFGLLVFAALTSAISLLEVVASYFIDEAKWPRQRAAWLIGGAIFLASIPSAFSMDPSFAMKGWEPSFGKNFFDTIDYLASNWMLPLGGLLISLYAGWIMPRRMRDAELSGLAPLLCTGWLILVRFVAPFLVLLVLAQKVGLLDIDAVVHAILR